MIARIPVEFGPSTVAVNTTLNRVYVGSAHSRELTIIDGATLRMVRRLSLPIAPIRFAVDDIADAGAHLRADRRAMRRASRSIDDPGASAPLVTGVGPRLPHGTVVFNADGSMTYTSDEGYFGDDSFTYTTTDGTRRLGSRHGDGHCLSEHRVHDAADAAEPGIVGTSYTADHLDNWRDGRPEILPGIGVLPGGLHLSEDGVLSGMPQQPGQFSFSVMARDLGQPALERGPRVHREHRSTDRVADQLEQRHPGHTV